MTALTFQSVCVVLHIVALLRVFYVLHSMIPVALHTNIELKNQIA